MARQDTARQESEDTKTFSLSETKPVSDNGMEEKKLVAIVHLFSQLLQFLSLPSANMDLSSVLSYLSVSLSGLFVVYALRVNLSVAIIAMMNSTEDESNKTSECPSSNATENISTDNNGEFNWTSDQKGLILGSFFFGYTCTQIIAGILSNRYGGKYLFGGGVLCSTLCSLLLPVAARSNIFSLLIANRVIAGVGEGVTFPAIYTMWGMWIPPLERSKLVSLSFAGGYFGIVIAQPVSGVFCASNFLGGWPSVFYVFGTIGLVWCVLWYFLAYDKPADHPRISSAELNYIMSTVSQEQATPDVPWVSILTSYPVWAIACAYFANNWGFYTLLTCLPLYLKHVLGYDVSQNGLISALPYCATFVVTNVSGFIADALRKHKVLDTTQTRKLFNGVGFIGPAIFLIAAGYVGCNNVLAILFISMATGFNGFTFSGFNENHIDITPRYAGIIMGISNTVGTIPGWISPIVVQQLTGNNGTREEWRYVFFIAGGVYIFGTLVYSTLATGIEQDWNKPKNIMLDQIHCNV